MNRWHADLCLLAVLGLAGACQAQTAEPLVSARPIPLQEGAPDRVTLGALRFEAGFQLGASDASFGGLSGIEISQDGHELLAVSDRGALWRATLEHEGDRLVGFADWQAADLGRVPGDPRRRIDAEDLADDGSGGLVVAVEGALPLRRITRDAPGTATPHPAAARLAEAGAADGNEGIEALAALPDGGLLALSEGVAAGPGALAAWRIEDDRVTPLPYLASDGFVPTGADRLDDIIYIVERRFSLADGGFASRVLALDLEQIRDGGPLRPEPLAVLSWPTVADNFEGIAARRAEDGSVLLYLLSDDNFLALQRTLLLQFSLAGP